MLYNIDFLVENLTYSKNSKVKFGYKEQISKNREQITIPFSEAENFIIAKILDKINIYY